MRNLSKLALLSAAALVGSTAAAAAPVSSGVVVSEGEAVFEYSGAPEDFTVPADVCALTIEAWGGSGGNAVASGQSEGEVVPVDPVEASPTPTAKGGYAKATIAVTPGEQLQVNVGGAGEDGQLPVGPSGLSKILVEPTPAAGGWPDGGDGGVARVWDDASVTPLELAPGTYAFAVAEAASGGGGGSSDVRRGGTGLGDRVLVAGGGGGSGAAAVAWALALSEALDAFSVQDLPFAGTASVAGVASGGGGGGLAGEDGSILELEDGADITVPDSDFSPAGGGTQSAGGAAGPDGGPGALGQGGIGSAGGEAGSDSGEFYPAKAGEVAAADVSLWYALAAASASAGGGGGGGYYGGGGGGSLGGVGITAPVQPNGVDAAADPDLAVIAGASAGSGGGGSGFGPAGTVFETGVNDGDGAVVLSWTVDPGCGAVAPAEAIQTPIRFTG